jgi:hypothetical protein
MRRSGLRSVYLHRVASGAPESMQVDHINHDKLDNRRENLRVCTNSQNQMNLQKRPGTLSEFKGVTYERLRRKWKARIKAGGRGIHLGYYRTQEEAATAYNAAATKAFGD